MSSDNFHIILFDGICNLCDGTVRWIIRHDKKGKFRFIAMQSEIGQTVLDQLQLPEKESNSVIYMTDKGIFTRSSAILHILHDLGNGWQFFYAFRWIPRFLRDSVYDLIAITRYKVFDRKEYCEIPDKLDHNRFILSEKELPDLHKLPDK